MERARVVQISDTHLSPVRAYGVPNAEAVVRYLNADPPDLVVHTGDIQLDNPDDDVDRRFAWELLRGITAPLVVIPGNHDVGDSGAEPWLGEAATPARLAAWLEVWGADRFSVDLAGWRLVGVNTMLLGSGTPAEEEQDAWLRRELATAARTVLFVHKPVCLHAPDVDDGPGVTIELPERRGLLDALAGSSVRLICSGHLHRFAEDRWADGVRTLWAPSTVFVGRDHGDGGVRHTGIVEHRFEGDEVTSTFVVPPGVVDVHAEAFMEDYGSMRFAPEQPWVT